MDALQTLIHQMEGSLRKVTRARTDNEITEELAQCLTHLLHAARALAAEEKKKFPNGVGPAPMEEGITITGMPIIDE